MKKNLVFVFVVIVVISISTYLTLNNNLTKISPPKSISFNENASKNNSPQILAKNLKVPWALDFLPNGGIIFTERVGNVKIYKNGDIKNIGKIDAKQIGEGGLLGLAVHPNFKDNHYLYFYYTYSSDGENTLNRVERYTLEDSKLTNKKRIINAIPGGTFHNGGRIKFGPDKLLYITTGDAQNPSNAQNRNSLAGKILRVKDDGSIAEKNPFKTRVFSYGHRNPQGIAWDSQGRLWETEHGPSGIWPNCCQDEINQIKLGTNFGWPNSVGKNISAETAKPIQESGGDTWAPSGAAIWKNTLFFGGLKGDALYKYNLNNSSNPRKVITNFGRIREVVLGPDNFLYLFTNNTDGRGTPEPSDDKLIRIDPIKL